MHPTTIVLVKPLLSLLHDALLKKKYDHNCYFLPFAIPLVDHKGNGGWSSWADHWNKACGIERSRTRTCNNPTPYCGGAFCAGSDTQRMDTCCPGKSFAGLILPPPSSTSHASFARNVVGVLYTPRASKKSDSHTVRYPQKTVASQSGLLGGGGISQPSLITLRLPLATGPLAGTAHAQTLHQHAMVLVVMARHLNPRQLQTATFNALSTTDTQLLSTSMVPTTAFDMLPHCL